MTICQICTQKKGVERMEAGERKRGPHTLTTPALWFKPKLFLMNLLTHLRNPQGRLLNSSNVSKIWIEISTSCFPRIRWIMTRYHHLSSEILTQQMSWLDKTLWHGISIRNQLIRTAPAEFHVRNYRKRKKLKFSFTDVIKSRKVLAKGKEKFSLFLIW